MGIEMTKRLCIYVIYDGENIIDDYIGYMLQELSQVCTSLVVVCNTEHIQQGLSNLQKNVEQVFLRKNMGFDAGAYKDALFQYVGWDKVREYDELILANDSFYGPLYPLNRFFSVVSTIKTDYWGMTRSQECMKTKDREYQGHIQSYFLAFRKNVINSSVFKAFWEQLEYPKTMDEAITYYELGINRCLEEKGFQSFAVSDLYQNILTFRKNENPYLKYPLELIRDCKIPVLKYKALSFGNEGYANAIKAYQFIRDNDLYDVAYIRKHILRKSKYEKAMIDFERLEKFQKNHEQIFIYGFGIYGKNLELYFQYRKWKVAGFLATYADSDSSKVIPFDQAEIRKEDGIIIAVGKETVCKEILEYLEGKCEKDQLLFPNYNLEFKGKSRELRMEM